MFRLNILLSFVIALMLAIALPALADEDKQDMARRAVLEGKVAPLSQLLTLVEREHKGDIVKIELENEDARKWGGKKGHRVYIYEIKVLTLAGELIKLKYNAKSFKLLTTNHYDRNDD